MTCRACGKAPLNGGDQSPDRNEPRSGALQARTKDGKPAERMQPAGQEAGTEGAAKEGPAADVTLKRIKLKFITKTLKEWPVQSAECPVFKSLTEEAEAIKAEMAVDQPWELQVLKAQEDVNTGKRR
eukprot:9089773-Heterocapsa_arctica.AAC.1